MDVFDSPSHVALSHGYKSARHASGLYRTLRGEQKVWIGYGWSHNVLTENPTRTAATAAGIVDNGKGDVDDEGVVDRKSGVDCECDVYDNDSHSSKEAPNPRLSESPTRQSKLKPNRKIAKICPTTRTVVKVFDSLDHVAKSHGYEGESQVSDLLRVLGGELETWLEHWWSYCPLSDMPTGATTKPASGDNSSNGNGNGASGDIWSTKEVSAACQRESTAQTSRLGRRRKHGKIAKICPTTGDVIKVFDSPQDVAQSFGYRTTGDIPQLYAVLAKKVRTFKGYHWSHYPFATDNDNSTMMSSLNRRSSRTKTKFTTVAATPLRAPLPAARSSKFGKISKICPTTGKVVKIFDSPLDVARNYGYDGTHCISQLYQVLGKENRTFKGYCWREFHLDNKRPKEEGPSKQNKHRKKAKITATAASTKTVGAKQKDVGASMPPN